MVDKYTAEERLSVLQLWLRGLKLEDIARQAKVSVGSVRNFVKELKDGKYPEFEGFLPYLEGMRYTSKQMESNSLGLPQVVTGLSVFHAMVELGLDPEKLTEFFRILQRIAPEDFPRKEFVRAVLRITELEKETGLRYEQLEVKASSLRAEVPELETTKKTLDDQVSSLKASATEEQKTLDQTLEAKKVTLRLLEMYGHDVSVLTSSGFKMEDVRYLADFLMKARDEEYVAAAIELAQLQKKTGKNYEELLAECKRAISKTETAKQELPGTRSELRKLTDDITGLKKEMEEELKDNKTTREELKRHIDILGRLGAIGVDFEQLEALQQLLFNVGNLGWKTPSVVAYLTTINDLEAAKKTKESELARITGAITEAKHTLEPLNNEITEAKAEHTKLTSGLSQIRATITQLTTLELGMKEQIELTDNLIQLLRDPSKLPISKISAVMLELQNLLGALMQPESYFYPPDYKPIRKKTIELVATILDKAYVLKEEADVERERLADQNTDLLMDKLGKMEQQRRKTEQEWAEVQKAKDEVGKLTRDTVTMTKETALKLVADQETEGIVKSYTCYLCNSTFTIYLGTPTCNEPKTCPSCSSPHIHRIQRFH